MRRNILRPAALALAAFFFAGSLAACGTTKNTGSDISSTVENSGTTESANVTFSSLTEEDTDTAYDPDSVTKITLNGTSASISGNGASVSGSTVIIAAAGNYLLEGTLTDGQIMILTDKTATVRLILNGVSITSTTSAAINGQQAGKIIVTLAEGSENSLCDGTGYADGDDAPTGTLYAKNDLTINGTGSLTVTGNCNNGIAAKDNLVITGGNIQVTAVGNGIRGKDSLTITDGNITVDAQEDGIKSANDVDTSKGWVRITGGTISVTSGEDGIHADSTLSISSGVITITQSYEGLEGQSINISGGEIDVTATDDGLNASGGSDSSSLNGRPGQNMFTAEEGVTIEISGGIISVTAGGDGIDSNGDLTFSGGVILVNGPSDDANCALDSNGAMTVNGGIIAAAGSSGMAENPSAGTQPSVAFYFTQVQQAGTPVHLLAEDGTVILSFTPEKQFSYIVFTSDELTEGMTVSVATGGTVSGGTTENGITSGGSTDDATILQTFAISGVTTSYSESGAVNGGMGNMGGGFGGGGFGGGRG